MRNSLRPKGCQPKFNGKMMLRHQGHWKEENRTFDSGWEKSLHYEGTPEVKRMFVCGEASPVTCPRPLSRTDVSSQEYQAFAKHKDLLKLYERAKKYLPNSRSQEVWVLSVPHSQEWSRCLYLFLLQTSELGQSENGLMWLSSRADRCGISDTAHTTFLSCVSCLSSLRVTLLTWKTFHSVLEDCRVYKCLLLPATCNLHAHYRNIQHHTHAPSWSLGHKGRGLSFFSDCQTAVRFRILFHLFVNL